MSEAKAMVDAIKTAVRYSRLSESHSGSFSRQCSIGRAALREEEISSRSADTGARIQSVGKREGGRREGEGTTLEPVRRLNHLLFLAKSYFSREIRELESRLESV